MTGSEKRWREGSHRVCPPNETWAKLKPLLPVLGITRVANITGLDITGIPVFMACRPNSRSLSVFQGKGLDADAARVSAVMEAYETWCAERIDAPLKFASVEELRFSHQIVDVGALPLTDVAGLDPQRPMLWVEADDLLARTRRWVPFEMVHANYALPEPVHSGALAATTNGLASGNTRDEAILHGLMEVIERDAITLWKLGQEAWDGASAVDLDSVDDPVCRSVLDRFEAAGIDIIAWDVRSDLGVPAFFCLAADRDEVSGVPEMGGGAHPAPEVALSRALTEAAQARATFIAGTREDIPDDAYATDELRLRRTQARELLDAIKPVRQFRNIDGYASESIADDIAATETILTDRGMGQLLTIDLNRPGFGPPVVRVIVPGLEAAFEGPESAYVPGVRAAQVLAEIAA